MSKNEVINDHKSNPIIKVIIGFAIIIASIAIIVLSITNLDWFKNIKTSNNNTNTETKTIIKTGEKEVIVTESGIADAVDKLYDATVIVEIKKNTVLAGWGSGFVYKTDDKYGYILTNHHVVDGYSKVTIVFTDEEEVEGEVIGSDVYSDVGVVRIPVKNVKSVAIIAENSESLRVGDTIFAIGTPVSLDYRFTVTRGILSGKDRLVSVSNNSIYKKESWYMRLYQIDAPINSGNSGGPLANANGEVIGITNSKLSSSELYYSSSTSIENIGFAIPIEDAISVAETLIKDGKIDRPSLGVSVIDTASASDYGIELAKNAKEGVLIVSVQEGSIAEKSGLKSGDIVVSFDDIKTTSYQYFKYILIRHKAGDSIPMVIDRDGKEVKINIKL